MNYTEELTSDEIEARILAAEDAATDKSGYSYIRPFWDAADRLIEYVQNPEGRFYLGLREIDAATRGFGPGELAFITGRPHGGKTQVVMNAINRQRTQRLLYFSFDEPEELVLQKLASLRTGIPGEELEQGMEDGDKDIERKVRRIARQDFSNLLVMDEPMHLNTMSEVVSEATDYWGEPPQAVFIDFLELMPGSEGERADSKAHALKAWTKRQQSPVICLHQAKRGEGGNRGKPVGMEDLRYGGEDVGIFVLGVWRKRDDTSKTEGERTKEQDTITVGIAKNKRPPCRRGVHDYYLDPDTGLIRELHLDDFDTSRKRIQDAMFDDDDAF